MKYLRHQLNRVTRAHLRTAGIWIACIIAVALIIYTHTPRKGTVAFTKEYATTLRDYSGESVRFDSFKYKPLVVFFWASWCPYCKGELMHLGELKQHYGDQVEIIAVNRKESPADAKAFTDPLQLQGISLLIDDTDDLFKELGGYAMPETIFINSRGEQVVHQHGPLSAAEADQDITQILH